MSKPVRVQFNRTKYGHELLVDVAWVHDIPTFILDTPHSLAFYDIILITKGSGWFEIDSHRHRVAPGTVLFTSPGQVRHWNTFALDGVCLFFTDEFIKEFLQDGAFVQRLPYFRVRPERLALRLNAKGALRPGHLSVLC